MVEFASKALTELTAKKLGFYWIKCLPKGGVKLFDIECTTVRFCSTKMIVVQSKQMDDKRDSNQWPYLNEASLSTLGLIEIE